MAFVRGSADFHPMLTESKSVTLSEEQTYYIDKVIDISSSDNQFAAKAKDAIKYILSASESELQASQKFNPPVPIPVAVPPLPKAAAKKQ